MRTCNAESQKRSAKVSHFKEDDSVHKVTNFYVGLQTALKSNLSLFKDTSFRFSCLSQYIVL